MRSLTKPRLNPFVKNQLFRNGNEVSEIRNLLGFGVCEEPFKKLKDFEVETKDLRRYF